MEVPRSKFSLIHFILILIIFSNYTLAEIPDPFELKLEDLANVKITSLTKNEESAHKSAAAIYVITQNDIQRSTANSIPELLRMVPGLNVAKVNSHTWAISSRGYNGSFSTKLLVLVDGRSVYDPIFSGVHWDQVDVVLSDIERIEIIRGPGATVWGANAVNGVINIITKKASDTQGTAVSVGLGNEVRTISSIRHGTKIGENAYARAYAKVTARDDSKLSTHQDSYDAWQTLQTGFRYDNIIDNKNSLTIHGDFLGGKENSLADFPLSDSPYSETKKLNGSLDTKNIVARYEHKDSDKEMSSIQLYYNDQYKHYILANEQSRIYDLELQKSINLNDTNHITIGGGYRIVDTFAENSDTTNEVSPLFNPVERLYDITNSFIQDEITIIPDKLKATIGTKFEYRNYTGLQTQPGIRLSYEIDKDQMVWTSASKAVRTPSQVERDVNFPVRVFPDEQGTPYLYSFTGNKNIGPENLYAYEIGHRYKYSRTLSFDTSIFANHYTQTIEAVTLNQVVNQGDFIVIPQNFQNFHPTDVYGAELLTNWSPYNWWKITAWYSYLDMHVVQTTEIKSPNHQFNIRSLTNIGDSFEFDPMIRYVSALDQGIIKPYTELDLRIGYRIGSNNTISLIGKNLLKESRAEFLSEENRRPLSLIERAVFLRFDTKF